MTKTLRSTLSGSFGLIAISSAQIVQTEPNDSIDTATPSTLVAGSSGGVLSMGNNGDGPFGPTSGDSTGDFDFFAIPANTGQTIIFDVDSNVDGTGMDSVIGLYNSSGALLTSNDDDGTSRDSFVRFTAPADGIYYGVVGNWVRGATDDAGSLPTDVTTPGTGRGAPGGAVDDYEVAILLDPEAYLVHGVANFPLIGPDQLAEGTVILRNEGAAAATITGLNFSGAGASAFGTDANLPVTIAAGQEVTINLTFEPEGSTEVFQASLEVVSDDAVRPTLSIALEEKPIEGLVFRLPFDDPAGSTTGAFGVPAETSGNGFQAAMVVNAGAPAPTFGRPPIAGTEGFAAFFNDANSSGNYVLTPNGFPHPATFSYSVWVKPTGGAGVDTIFNRDEAFSQGDSIFGCSILDGGTVMFRIAGTEIVLSEDGAVPDDSVHHIVVTHLDEDGFGDFKADRTRLYIDGKLVAENTDTFEVPEYTGDGNSRLWIGTRSAAGTGFNGDMDEFQFYNTELSEQQVTQLFENPNSVATNAPAKAPAITALSLSGDGTEADLVFDSAAGTNYLVESSTDLVAWAEVADSVESEGSQTTVTVPVLTPGGSPVFFRVAVEE